MASFKSFWAKYGDAICTGAAVLAGCVLMDVAKSNPRTRDAAAGVMTAAAAGFTKGLTERIKERSDQPTPLEEENRELKEELERAKKAAAARKQEELIAKAKRNGVTSLSEKELKELQTAFQELNS